MISRASKIIFLVSLFLAFTKSQVLKAEYAKIELPYSLYSASPVYDGEDSIYLLGGIGGNGDGFKRILRFNITSETIETVGELFYGSFQGQTGAHMDSNGRIFYIGGGQSVQIFEPSIDSISRNVTNLPYDIIYSSRIPLDDDKILILGGGDRGGNLRNISIFDMKTLEVTVLNETLPFGFTDSRGARLGNKAFIFGYPYQVTNLPAYLINLETLETELPPATFNFPRMSYEPSVLSNGHHFYLIAGESNEPSKPVPTNGIVQFDKDDFSWNFMEVEDFLIQDFEFFYRPPASIFIDKLNRIYSFGGITRNFSAPGYTVNRKEIWYIDLSPVTPTEAPSTTLRPDLFSCFNRTDGFYPHPEDCAKFIGCHGEVSEVYDCPVPLLFDPVEERCEYAENVECGLTCIGRPDGQYSHPHDCALFFMCRSEELEVFRCPSPLLFDPDTLRCEYPESVQCNTR